MVMENELPQRFYLSAHSAGGYQAMLYASYHPERIEAMFLQSPACTEDTTRADWVYDPYTIRLVDNEDVYPSRSQVDQTIENYANDVHLQSSIHSMPYFVVKIACGKEMRKMIPAHSFSEEFIDAAGRYYALMTQRWGKQDIVTQKCLRYFCFPHNTLFTKERMLQDFDFPIAFVNGTRDFFGSAEGSDTIVKNNKHYSSGRSQIFKLQNSGHNVFLDNVD